MKRTAAALTLLFCLALSTCAQQPQNGNVSQRQSEISKRAQQFIEEEKNKMAQQSEPMLPEAIDPGTLDDTTKERYFASLREYYDYRISGFTHRKRVFEWQLFSSKVIFIIVTLLVLSGIYFSGVQFHKSLKQKRSRGESVTEIEASFKGIRVSSSILGIIILTISFLFFYLYLVHVYPITNTF